MKCVNRYLSITILLLGFLLQASHAHAEGESFGGSGGNVFSNLNCPANQALVGLKGIDGMFNVAKVIIRLQVICVRMTADMDWDGIPKNTPEFTGGSSGSGFTLQCPQDQFVIGISGQTAGQYVDTLAIICENVTDGASSRTLVGPQGGFVPAGTGDYQGLCDSTTPPRIGWRITGRSGAVIDAIQLDCASVPLPDVTGRPQLLLPSDGAIADGQRPRLEWEVGNVVNARSWKVSVREFNPPGEVLFRDDIPVTQRFIVPGNDLFPDGGSVRWEVQGCNRFGEGCGPWTESWRINPPAPPPPPPPPPPPEEDPEVFGSLPGDNLCGVYKDDRCVNCHSENNHSEDPPLDDCGYCHFASPSQDPDDWILAPLPGQDFADKTCADICETVRGWSETHDFYVHIHEDPRIEWAFDPDGFAPDDNEIVRDLAPNVVMTFGDFQDASVDWANAEFPCPTQNKSTPTGSADKGSGNKKPVKKKKRTFDKISLRQYPSDKGVQVTGANVRSVTVLRNQKSTITLRGNNLERLKKSRLLLKGKPYPGIIAIPVMRKRVMQVDIIAARSARPVKGLKLEVSDGRRYLSVPVTVQIR